MTNKIIERIVKVIGSTPVILLSLIWVVYHTATTQAYVSFISDATYMIALLVLRDDKVQAEFDQKLLKEVRRLAKSIKEYAKKDLSETRKLRKEIKH